MEALNLDWLTDALAVGGELPAEAYAPLAREHGLSAVIDLRAEACDDASALRALGIAHLHVPVEDHRPPTIRQFDAAVGFAGSHLDRGGRVFLHCREGVGRAPIVALALLSARGMAPAAALALTKERRWQVSPNPDQYEAWAAWVRERRPRADVPPFDRFAAVAYRHLTDV